MNIKTCLSPEAWDKFVKFFETCRNNVGHIDKKVAKRDAEAMLPAMQKVFVGKVIKTNYHKFSAYTIVKSVIVNAKNKPFPSFEMCGPAVYIHRNVSKYDVHFGIASASNMYRTVYPKNGTDSVLTIEEFQKIYHGIHDRAEEMHQKIENSILECIYSNKNREKTAE